MKPNEILGVICNNASITSDRSEVSFTEVLSQKQIDYILENFNSITPWYKLKCISQSNGVTFSIERMSQTVRKGTGGAIYNAIY